MKRKKELSTLLLIVGVGSFAHANIRCEESLFPIQASLPSQIKGNWQTLNLDSIAKSLQAFHAEIKKLPLGTSVRNHLEDDLQTRETQIILIHRLAAESTNVSKIALSPDGKLAVRSIGGEEKIYDLAEEALRPKPGKEIVLDLDHMARQLTSYENEIESLVKRMAPSDPEFRDKVREHLQTELNQKKAQLARILNFVGDRTNVDRVALSAEGNSVIVRTKNGEEKTYDLKAEETATKTVIKTKAPVFKGKAFAVDLDLQGKDPLVGLDGKLLIVANDLGLRIYDISSGDARIQYDSKQPAQNARLVQNGEKLVSFDLINRKIRVLDLKEMTSENFSFPYGASKEAQIEVSADGKQIAFADDRKIQVLNLNGNLSSYTYDRGWISQIQFAKNNTALILRDSRGYLTLLDLQTMKTVFVSESEVRSFMQTSDSNQILISDLHGLSLLSLENFKQQLLVEYDSINPTSARLSKGRNFLIVRSDFGLHLVDLKLKKDIVSLKVLSSGPFVEAFDVDSSGNQLAYLLDGKVKIIDLRDMKQIAVSFPDVKFKSVQFTPDGSTLIATDIAGHTWVLN